MVSDILHALDKTAVAEFTRDFCEVLRVAAGMESVHNRGAYPAAEVINRFRDLVISFNRKYKGVSLNLSNPLRIFLSEKSVKDIFTSVATKISGLRSIGVSRFEEATLEESEKFSSTIANIRNEVYLTYYYPERGSDNIYLRYDPAAQKIEIFFDYDYLRDPFSAQFRLCAFYGVKGGVDSSIEVYNVAASFGFVDASTLEQQRAYRNKFDPIMYE
ncbi:MAG TPA: hypothetical protein VJH97_06130 [Candidatus Nanoarchaeia archaeon]|nr:hypothetical protein [Candidatus Nanoarchaeia archaeon]